MTPTAKDKLSKTERQATLHDLLQERMRLAIGHTLITVLEEEVEGFIQRLFIKERLAAAIIATGIKNGT